MDRIAERGDSVGVLEDLEDAARDVAGIAYAGLWSYYINSVRFSFVKRTLTAIYLQPLWTQSVTQFASMGAH